MSLQSGVLGLDTAITETGRQAPGKQKRQRCTGLNQNMAQGGQEEVKDQYSSVQVSKTLKSSICRCVSSSPCLSHSHTLIEPSTQRKNKDFYSFKYMCCCVFILRLFSTKTCRDRPTNPCRDLPINLNISNYTPELGRLYPSTTGTD